MIFMGWILLFASIGPFLPVKSTDLPSFQSQRDCETKPRVARDELPWENAIRRSQPQRGCVGVKCERQYGSRDVFATPLGLLDILRFLPRVAPASQPWALLR